MESFSAVLNALLPLVLIAIGVALVVFIVELIKTVKTARGMLVDAEPIVKNAKTMTDDLVPVVKKTEPLVDRVQLTLDAVNLEMMRVDEILEDVSQITDTAASATTAVDNIAHAPVKAVSNVATRVRGAFGTKSASDESAQLAEQRVAVAKALEDYKAAERQEAERSEAEAVVETESAEEIVEEAVEAVETVEPAVDVEKAADEAAAPAEAAE